MPKIIGTAVERIDGELVQQVCTGTIAEDIRDRGFPFRIMFSEHAENFPMHGHDYAELAVVLGGQAMHQTEYEIHPIARGDVFVMTGERRHGFGAVEDLVLCNIQFDPQWFFEGAMDLQEMMGFHGFFDLETRSPEGRSFRQRLRLVPTALAEVENLLRQIEAEFRGDSGGRRTLISGLFLMLATRLSRIYEAERNEQPVAAVAVAAAAAYIRRHFRRSIRIDELAETAGLSASQLQRSFRRFYGTTPVVMINRLRVEAACHLLVDRNLELNSIASELGYASASFFSTQFRQLMGMSPREFRKQRLNVLETLQRVRVAPIGVGENGGCRV